MTRIDKLQQLIATKKIDFLIIDDPISLKYLTGLSLSSGRLCVKKDAEKLFVDGRYIEMVKKSETCRVGLLEEKGIIDFFVSAEGGSKRVGFDSLKTSYRDYQNLLKLIDKIEKRSKDIYCELEAMDNPLRDFRGVKDSQEIAALKRSAALNWKGFEHVCSLLKTGITEEMVALEFEIFCRKQGAESLAFCPIVSFGTNTSFPHHRSDTTVLKDNDIIMIDVGVVVDSYCSDMTRCVFLEKPDPFLEKLYEIVKTAQREALSICRAGVHIGEVDKKAREVITREGYEKNILHATGHGVGLEIHEFPKIKYDDPDGREILRAGMVITVEPAIYLPNVGGVRYEDTVVVTNEGYENFYSA